MIIDLEVVTRKFLGSTNFSRGQTLYVHKLLEIVIVVKHENFMLRAF